LSKWPGGKGRFASFCSKLFGGLMTFPTTALIRATDETVGRLAPVKWGRIALTVVEKI
ncbi:MAG: hypothetical protein RL367_490, partial [Pseudomonadota bacterium]